MSKIIQLYSDKDKKIKAYPKTLASQVYMDDGTTTIKTQLDHIVQDTNNKFGGVENKKLDKNGIVTMANMGQDVKEAMTGGSVAVVGKNTVLKDNIVNKQVTIEKTDFISTGKNLFDKTTVKSTWINYNTGVDETLAGYCSSDFIEVTPSTKYTRNLSQSTVFYDVNFTFISGQSGGKLITTPSNCKYVRLNLTNDYLNKPFQFELGEIETEYEPFYIQINKRNKYEQAIPKLNSVNINSFNNVANINMFNKDTVKRGYYIDTTGKEVAYGSDAGGISDYMPVYGGMFYTYQNGSDNTGFQFAGAWYDENKILISTISPPQPYPTKMTVKAPLNAMYLRINYLTPKLNEVMCVQGNTYPPSYSSYGAYIDWLKSKVAINNENDNNVILQANKFYGKKANFLGDSITFGFGVGGNTGSYVSKLKDKLGLSLARNYGISSTLIAHRDNQPVDAPSFVDRYNQMDNDADVIFVFGGTNDYYVGNGAIGNINSTDIKEFNGALNTLIIGLQNKYPNKDIIFITPVNSEYLGKNSDTPNTNTNLNLKGYRDCIIERCEYHSIPVIDLFSVCGMNVGHNPNHKTLYSVDGVHPNDLGHSKICDVISSKIRSI